MLRAALLAFAVALAAALPAASQNASAPGAASAAQSPSTWKLFRYPEQHVMFRAPADAQPRLNTKMSPSGGTTVPEAQIAVVDAGGWAWMISVGDFTATNGQLNIDAVPPGAAAGIGARIVGPVRTVSIPGVEQAREYDAASDKLMGKSRVLLQSRRLYQALALTDASTLPPNTDAFLQSVTPLN